MTIEGFVFIYAENPSKEMYMNFDKFIRTFAKNILKLLIIFLIFLILIIIIINFLPFDHWKEDVAIKFDLNGSLSYYS